MDIEWDLEGRPAMPSKREEGLANGVSGKKIRPEVKQFIENTINSAEQLEVLIFVMSNADSEWTAQGVSDRTMLPVDSTEQKLSDLAGVSLLSVRNQNDAVYYQYSPTSSALEKEVAESLQQAYREGRDTLIRLIYSKPLQNIKFFADAFRLKEDD